MTSRAQSIRVGLFAAAAIALAAIVLIVFGGMRFWERSDSYRIVFDSSVYGLHSGAEVHLNGIKAGAVARIEVDRSDIRKVVVEIKLKEGTPVHTDTRAMLQYAGITGLKVIDLRDGTLAAPRLPPGSQITAGVGVIDKLEAQAQTIVDQSTELMKRANQLADNLIAVTGDLGAITRPARQAAENVAAMSGSLQSMINDNRAAVAQTLAAVRQTANAASDLIDGQVAQMLGNASDVTAELKKLITANEGPLRAAVFDLRQASRSFKELARDVRQKPSRLLFSSSPAERQLP
jgi:phospholipid/cholesterol/gamma-HCH transport system substrate-binding protein